MFAVSDATRGVLCFTHRAIEFIVVTSMPLVAGYGLDELLNLRSRIASEDVNRLALLLRRLECACLAPVVVLRRQKQVRAGYIVHYFDRGVGVPDRLLELTLVHAVRHYVSNLDWLPLRFLFRTRVPTLSVAVERHTRNRRRPSIR